MAGGYRSKPKGVRAAAARAKDTQRQIDALRTGMRVPPESITIIQLAPEVRPGYREPITNLCIDPKPVDRLTWLTDDAPSGGTSATDTTLDGLTFRVEPNVTFGYGFSFSLPSVGLPGFVDPLTDMPLLPLDQGDLTLAFNVLHTVDYTVYARLDLFDADGVLLGVPVQDTATFIKGGTDDSYVLTLGDWGQPKPGGSTVRSAWGIDVDGIVAAYPAAVFAGLRFSVGQPILPGELDGSVWLGHGSIYTGTDATAYRDGDSEGWESNEDGTSTGPRPTLTAWDEVDHPDTFPPSSHTHLISEIVGLITALGDKQAVASLDEDVAALVADTSPSDLRDAIMTLLATYPGLLPTGGSGGFVLAKASGVDFDVEWVDPTDPSSGFATPPQLDEYAAPQTGTHWVMPPDAKIVEVEVLGPGGGGGSGRRGAVGSQRCGGGAGSGGGYSVLRFDASDLPADLYVWAPSGATGAAAVTTNDTSGSAGSSALSAFVSRSSSGTRAIAEAQSLVWAGGGTGGGGGGPSGSSTHAAGGLGQFVGGQGGPSSLVGNGDEADIDRNGAYNGGGGGGVSLTTGNSPNHQGGRGFAWFKGRIGSVRAAADPDPVGNAGLDGSTSSVVIAGQLAPGCGGAGGASGSTTDATVAGGRGGHGYLGGGGGGGGTSSNGANSGAGGNGGDSYVRITTYF